MYKQAHIKIMLLSKASDTFIPTVSITVVGLQMAAGCVCVCVFMHVCMCASNVSPHCIRSRSFEQMVIITRECRKQQRGALFQNIG